MSESNIIFSHLDVDQIQPNPFQPREIFEKESIKELSDSIKQGDVIQPIIVRKKGTNYEIIAGERRWRAAKMAGLRKIPALIKDIPDNRVLLESLIENLHRLDLTDIERENAVHELWENRDNLRIETYVGLAKILGISPSKVSDDIEAWEARHEKDMSLLVSTRTIASTRGLEPKIRKRIVEKVAKKEYGASEVNLISKIIRKAPEPITKELLKKKPRITPKMAEAIVEKLPTKEEQEAVFKETVQHRLTEDELESRIRDIKISREKGVAPIVDRRIVIKGQWLVNRIHKPISDLLSINPESFGEMDEAQKDEVIELLKKLDETIRKWMIQLKEVKVVDMR